jgi:hypothetical protein
VSGRRVPVPGAARGRAVQVEPMNSMLKVLGIIRLKLQHDELLSNFAFNFNLSRYTGEGGVRRCKLIPRVESACSPRF